MFKRKKKKRAPYLQPFPANWFVVSALLFACMLTVVVNSQIGLRMAENTALTSSLPWVLTFDETWFMCCCSLPFVWAVAILSVIFNLGGTTVDRRAVSKRGQEIP